MPQDLPYRDFLFPLNVFMFVLSNEEGGVRYLHYGFFDGPGDSIVAAQDRATEMLLSRLPQPPASILEAGIGLGTTLARLTREGYDATGITPDAHQIAMVRGRFGDELEVHCSAFETFDGGGRYDAVLFQESSQYIAADALFARARDLTSLVLVADEFATQPVDTPGALHSYDGFVAAAGAAGFRITEEVDVTEKAMPTIDYFLDRLPRYRHDLVASLGISTQQVDDLITSGENYRDLYRSGKYAYRVITLSSRA